MRTDEKDAVVAECKNMKEFTEAIKTIGAVEGSRGIIYTPHDNWERLALIMAGDELRLMTRAHGLRAKLAELLKRDA